MTGPTTAASAVFVLATVENALFGLPSVESPLLVLAALEGVVLALVAGVTAPLLARAVTATVGFFVAYQAYRGYRRNDSRPMLFLGLGICSVTTLSFVVSTLVVEPLGASDGLVVLSWTALHVAGLASIFYAFTGATAGRR